MKNFFKVLSLAVVAAFVLASCQKEEGIVQNTIMSGVNPNSEASELDIFRTENHGNATTKKGYLMDYSALVAANILETGIATDDQQNEYTTLKIPREDGSCFFIMIENYKYNDSQYGSWAYNNSSTNEENYGRLYFWEKAEELKNRVWMELPSAWNIPVKVFGQLPTIEYIKLLLNKPAVPSNADKDGVDEYSPGLFSGEIKCSYFDIFAFGISQVGLDGGYHSLGGNRDNLEGAPNNTEFVYLNERGCFWTNNGDSYTNTHYPLEVLYKSVTGDTYKYSAYINAEHANHFGYSVRYVFDPF